VIPAGNVTVELPAVIASGDGADVPVEVVIPDDALAGTYEGTITIIGNDGTEDAVTVRVTVHAVEDLDIVEDEVSTIGGPATEVSTMFTVVNADETNNPDEEDGYGNVDLYGVEFVVTDNLVDATGTHTIGKDAVSFVPAIINVLNPGDAVGVMVKVEIPDETYATTYHATITATNATGTTKDEVTLNVTVNPYYELDIVEPYLELEAADGATTTDVFTVENLSNIEVTDLTYSVTDLTDGAGNVIPAANVTFDGPTSVGWKEEAEVEVTVSVPDDQPAGTYEGMVTVAGGGVSATMALRVTVTRGEAVIVSDAAIEGEENATFTDTIIIMNTGNCELGPVHVEIAGDLVLDGAYGNPNAAKIDKDNVVFIPSIISSLPDNAAVNVVVRVTIPRGTLMGTYIAPIVVYVGSEEGEVAGEGTLTVEVVERTETATQITAIDNPVRDNPAVVRYVCDAGYKPTLTLINMAGEKVLEVELDDSGIYTWDLRDEDGERVASGVYLVFIKTKVNGTERILRYKLFIIR